MGPPFSGAERELRDARERGLVESTGRICASRSSPTGRIHSSMKFADPLFRGRARTTVDDRFNSQHRERPAGGRFSRCRRRDNGGACALGSRRTCRWNHGFGRSGLRLRPAQHLTWVAELPSQRFGDVRVEPGQTRKLPPAGYGSVHVEGGTLELSAGTYSFRSLEIERDGTLRIVHGGQAVVVYVTTSSNSAVRPTTRGDASHLIFAFSGDHGAFPQPASCDVVAPLARSRARTATDRRRHQGTVIARALRSRSDDAASRSLCPLGSAARAEPGARVRQCLHRHAPSMRFSGTTTSSTSR